MSEVGSEVLETLLVLVSDHAELHSKGLCSWLHVLVAGPLLYSFRQLSANLSPCDLLRLMGFKAALNPMDRPENRSLAETDVSCQAENITPPMEI